MLSIISSRWALICLKGSQSEIVRKGNVLYEEQRNSLSRTFSRAEIKAFTPFLALKPQAGPDGYKSSFYKLAWEEIGEDIIEAVQQFFENGKLLKELNCTTLTLIPKVDSPTSVMDFRPIACCNVLYKCITNDLILFSKGDVRSINFLLRSLATFVLRPGS